MKFNVAKILIRVVGTIAGIVGVTDLWVSLVIFRPAITSDGPWTIRSLMEFSLQLLMLLIGPYLVWVGYLVWFRFSPLAVRHACGFLGYLFWGALIWGALLYRISEPTSPWLALAGLGSLVFVCWAYRAGSRYLIRLLFSEPPTPPGASPATPTTPTITS